ncbi:MAG TPA: efflux RND transporter periplasmic adaptor subunit [Rhodanobacteraceae bacterium]|nr:efflux RND transporter periplasmic adaptor subunit [Rhodanobacteraceae bacterium]
MCEMGFIGKRRQRRGTFVPSAGAASVPASTSRKQPARACAIRHAASLPGVYRKLAHVHERDRSKWRIRRLRDRVRMSSRAFPRVSLAGIFAASLCVALAACSRDTAPHVAPPAPVTVVKTVRKDMPVLLSAVGSVEPINSVSVKSLIDGQILESLVNDGGDVTQNQLLFRIDPRPAEAALKQAEAAQAKDEAALAQARSQVKRYSAIAGKGYISADQMEQYRTNLDAAAASVKVDQANVAAAKVTLGYTEIRSPIAGRIGRILIQPGNLVKANDTNPLVVINQIEPIYVSFSLPGTELGPILVGQRASPLAVEATVAGVPKPVEGKVAFVDNAVDSTTGTVKLRATFDNPEHLLWPGQLVSVSLTLGHDANAVVVPDRAVQNGPEGTYVFVVKPDRKAEQRKVVVKRRVENEAVIESGLADGETVVLDGQSRVEDGSALKIADEANASDGAGSGAAEARP